MEYQPGRFRDRQEFLRAHDQRWVHELHDVLKELLDPQRLTLGIGSGEGEHEVLLHEAGYRVIASDVVPGVLDDAARLFPGLETRLLDVFGDDVVECDDVLAGGIDFYFDDAEAADLFAAVRRRLIPGGRFVVVLRYRDNLATTAIDRVGLPALAWAQRRRGAHARAQGARVPPVDRRDCGSSPRAPASPSGACATRRSGWSWSGWSRLRDRSCASTGACMCSTARWSSSC